MEDRAPSRQAAHGTGPGALRHRAAARAHRRAAGKRGDHAHEDVRGLRGRGRRARPRSRRRGDEAAARSPGAHAGVQRLPQVVFEQRRDEPRPARGPLHGGAPQRAEHLRPQPLRDARRSELAERGRDEVGLRQRRHASAHQADVPRSPQASAAAGQARGARRGRLRRARGGHARAADHERRPHADRPDGQPGRVRRDRRAVRGRARGGPGARHQLLADDGPRPGRPAARDGRPHDAGQAHVPHAREDLLRSLRHLRRPDLGAIPGAHGDDQGDGADQARRRADARRRRDRGTGAEARPRRQRRRLADRRGDRPDLLQPRRGRAVALLRHRRRRRRVALLRPHLRHRVDRRLA